MEDLMEEKDILAENPTCFNCINDALIMYANELA
jgi:hypothetical protein